MVVEFSVPGTTATTRRIAVSRAGAEPGLPLRQLWRPEDLLAAWAA
ncbi:hypothetical protein ABGB18_30960 [Nonomuraea sp. B12E4]